MNWIETLPADDPRRLLGECRDFDANKRAELVQRIADASALARKQAHRSLDTAILIGADDADQANHEADIAATRMLRRALGALGHHRGSAA